jgi:hypothetical protein
LLLWQNECGVNHFLFFDVEEQKIITKALASKVTVMIMGYIDQDMDSNNIEFCGV